uniref:Interleukin-21 protein n=1 Tax=Channa argus TaxID=215402 RepID=A0A977TNE0_CHAAH|nr:interleukin-21 protein [Channa argus]
MKLVLLCVFAVCCGSLANPITNVATKIQRRKLQEVLRQLNEVKSLQHNETMLSAPPENIEDCCCLSALQCFQRNLNEHFNMAEKKQQKLHRSLTSQITVKGLEFCSPGTNFICQNCSSHPKVSVQEFFNRLESLIQRAIVRLSMD